MEHNPPCFYTGDAMALDGEEIPQPGYWVGLQSLLNRFYAWLLRRMPTERQRLLAVTILAGALCGLAAVAFHLSIQGLEALLIDRANSVPLAASWPAWASPTLHRRRRAAAFRK